MLLFSSRLWRILSRLAVDRPYRNMVALRLWRPKGAFQLYNVTGTDRYPQIFAFVQSRWGAQNSATILSAGCSTGEEVFTLRRYFPHAVVKGVDINPGNIAACNAMLKKHPDPALSFACASLAANEPANSCDMVFCMAVLRDGRLNQPGVVRCDHLIRFELFAAAVADFHRCLKPGGLLIIRHSNFRLRDTPLAENFETVFSLDIQNGEKSPIFGPANDLLAGVEYTDTVFRKTR